MPIRRLICCAALVLATSAAVAQGPVIRPAALTSAAISPSDTVTRYYSLTVRFRPFLIWMTRDDVGGARISWSPSPGPDRWVELLVGSDPERAPMSINRWGFISEQALGGTALLTGIMTETDEKSIDGARGNAAAMADGRAFRVIRSTVRNGEATTAIGRLFADTNVTYRQYAALLDRFPAGASEQHLRVAPGVEPGLLVAMKALVHESVETWRARRVVAGGVLRRDCIYAGKVYQVSLRGATLANQMLVDGSPHGPAIDGEFEIRNQVTGTTTDFQMAYGLSGPEAETPLRLVYRPRWWIELQLDIVATGNARRTLAMSQLSPPRNPNTPR